jgi:hypothetical protein
MVWPTADSLGQNWRAMVWLITATSAPPKTSVVSMPRPSITGTPRVAK